MPKCRICDARVEPKSSVCPVCGCPNPCDSRTRTIDLTMDISDVVDNVDFHYKSKKKAALLVMLLDIFGIGTRYLGYRRTSWLLIALNIALVIGAYFIGRIESIGYVLAYIGIFVLIYGINIIRGLVILFTNSFDANGDVLE